MKEIIIQCTTGQHKWNQKQTRGAQIDSSQHIIMQDIFKNQETKLTPKAKTPKVHSFTTVRTDRSHCQRVGKSHSLQTI